MFTYGVSDKSIKIKYRKTITIFHEVRRSSYSTTAIFGENIDSFSKLKVIGLDQRLSDIPYFEINFIQFLIHDISLPPHFL